MSGRGKGPLAGVRVLDLTSVLMGPYATQIFADLGADVVKIERPMRNGAGGDDTRGWGPPFLRDRDGHDTAEAAYYLGTNRNKRSVTVDIAQPSGQALIRRMAVHSDVFVENFKVGDMARYGLDSAQPQHRSLTPWLELLRGCLLMQEGEAARSLPHNMRAHEAALEFGLLRVAILTGAGRCFSAGVDLKAQLAALDAGAGGPMDLGVAMYAALLHSPKPLIAAINGPALGAGPGRSGLSRRSRGSPTSLRSTPTSPTPRCPNSPPPMGARDWPSCLRREWARQPI